MNGRANDVEVDPGALAQAAQQVLETRSHLSDNWDAIRERARTLFESSWTGAAATSYAQPWSECEEGFGEILASLEYLGRAVNESGRQFQSSDARNAADIEGSATTGLLNLDV